MKNVTLKGIATLSGILLLCLSSNASHFIGVDMRFECLDPCTYRIYHNAYYDCAGGGTTPLPGPPNAPSISFVGFPNGCTSNPIPVTFNWIFQSYIEVTPVCPALLTQTACTNGANPVINGVLEGVFYRDYNICMGGTSPCTSLEFSWSTCCRSYSITSGASGNDLYVNSTLYIDSTLCNSSPLFAGPPVSIFPSGQVSTFDLGAVDPDGDSLAYTLGSCMMAMGVPVPYTSAGGYSPSQPLGANWDVSLDGHTGIITFTPNPGGIVVAVICIEVKEYRNGVLIGTYPRDMQVETIAIGPNQIPSISNLNNLTGLELNGQGGYDICLSSPISFSIVASDPDLSDTLSFETNISSVLNGAIVTISGANPLIMNVSWTPSIADTSLLPFFVNVSDNVCPLPFRAFSAYEFEPFLLCISDSITASTCSENNGEIDVTVSGGVPPYTFLWNTGATTEDLSGIPPGVYDIQIIDATGLIETDTFWVSASDFMLQTTLTQPTCDAVLGAISTNVLGGTPPISYLWNTGSTSSMLTGLGAGGYSVMATDASGCVVQAIAILETPDSCFVSVAGRVYDDGNNNCVQDVGESGRPWILIDISPGPSVYTNINGDYYFPMDTGTYFIEQNVGSTPFLSPNCPPGGGHQLDLTSYENDTSGIDFANEVIPYQDIRVSFSNQWAVNAAGQIHLENIFYHNAGSVPVLATLEWTHDPLLQFIGATTSPNIYDVNTYSGSWNLGLLAPGESGTIVVTLQIDSTALVGAHIESSVTLLPLVGDLLPGNNVDSTSIFLAASYDPNDKQVSPVGIGSEGYIGLSNNPLKYTIRFQNTGNFTAFHVVIRDTLASELVPASFQPGAFSHPYSVSLENDEVLVFDFPNILLPDSASDPNGSQGFVSFYLSYDSASPPFTVIKNDAAIYFDFNDPIITNNTQNTLILPLEIEIMGNDSLAGCRGDTLRGEVIDPTGVGNVEFLWNSGASGEWTLLDESGWYVLNANDGIGYGSQDSIWVEVVTAEAYFRAEITGLDVSFVDSIIGGELLGWDFGDDQTWSSSNPTHSYASADSFWVSLFVENECGLIDTISQWIDLTGLVSLESDLSEQVKVSPNPFTERTIISFPNDKSQPFRLNLLDLRGRVVRTYDPTRESQIEIHRGALSSGIYLIELIGPYRYFGKLRIE